MATTGDNAGDGQFGTSHPHAPEPRGETQSIVTVDDSHAVGGYANFFRVLGTAEEIVLDLGLDPQPFATGARTVKVSQRIVMNHYTAKRLLSALAAAVQRHEKTFGALETDVMKRVKAKP